MAAKGYCVAADVEVMLGRTFTAAQHNHAENLIERAEIWIDTYTNRGWLVGVQTNEAHFWPSFLVYLDYSPIDSVTSVNGRTDIGEAETALVVDDDYEVRDLATGLIYLVEPSAYDRIRVTYTPTAAVPADITQACIELAAAWLQPHLSPGSYGIDSYSLPDLTVRYARSHVQEVMPPTVRAILDAYRHPQAG